MSGGHLHPELEYLNLLFQNLKSSRLLYILDEIAPLAKDNQIN